MKKINFILPLLLFIFSSTLIVKVKANTHSTTTAVSASDLTGTWIMSNIEANDMIEIAVSEQRSEPIDNSGKTKQAETMSIPLKKILLKELSLGNTKFVFSNGTFSFYRKTSLTFSGNWTLNADQLTLKYKSGNGESIKLNKIIKLTDNLLIMESESYNKKVIFTFTKKQ